MEEQKKPTWYGEHVRSYTNISNLKAVNCGIRGDRTQNVLWRVENMYLPASVAVGLIHCVINGTAAKAYRPHKIAENIILCHFKLRERHPLRSNSIAGILPAEETNWGRTSRIEQVNNILKELCSSCGFLFIEQDACWRDHSGNINQNLFWRDGLHLNKRGCELLKYMYINAINECKQSSNFPSSRVNPSPSLLSSPLPYFPEPPPYHHVSPPNPHINLSSSSYHRYCSCSYDSNDFYSSR